MRYLMKISTLEESAAALVAINLCQENRFKEVALCLEKPTYGAFISERPSIFVSDPEKLSAWSGLKEDDPLFEVFEKSCHMNSEMKKLWDAAVDEQCDRLTEGLPCFLKEGVHAWINRIALEYLSYSRRQEVLFGVSRYFLMDFLTREDWTVTGRLNEKKLAIRFLRETHLTFLQRYRIACAYCLRVNTCIPQLWQALTEEEKLSVSGNYNPHLPPESHRLVLLWSHHGYRGEKVFRQKSHQWTNAAQQAVRYGNHVALVSCWINLKKDIRQQMAIDLALQSLEIWQSLQNKSQAHNWGQQLVSNELPISQSDKYVKYFNLPSYYSEFMTFFLTEIDEEQQLIFFKQAFQSRYSDSVVECFLDWPHQDHFLPTISRLWGIIPKDKYGQCLLTLASKYSGNHEKENRYYDYRSLLWTLWEKTPAEYKQYVFCDKKTDGIGYLVVNEGKVLLPRLLGRSPFQEKDEALFKLVFRDQPQEERRAMMFSKAGEHICSILTQKENWPFMNWLLEECLPKEEIPSFKKQFIRSHSKLEEIHEQFVELEETVVNLHASLF